MQQYYRFKRKHPECVLLFRIGDFYEMFDDDAVRVSKALGLTLTQRSAGVPLAGVPFHQLETYLRRMVALGMRVAVCEQVEDASKAKGLVARAVTRVITPGTLVDENLLDHDTPSTLAALAFTGDGEDSPAALAIVDLSTGDFSLWDGPAPGAIDELARRGVRELLFAQNADGKTPPRTERLLRALGLAGTPRQAWEFRADEGLRALREQFRVATLEGFGITDRDGSIGPAGAVVRYLRETQALGEAQTGEGTDRGSARTLEHLRPPKRDTGMACCHIDAVSLRALEVEGLLRAAPGTRGTLEGTLLGVFLTGPGACRTAMGRRTVREWLVRPCREMGTIRARHDAVGGLLGAARVADELDAELSGIQDVARIAGRASLGRMTPRDLTALGASLSRLDRLSDVIDGTAAFAAASATLRRSRSELGPVAEEIVRMCVESPPPHMREGGLIRDGVDPALDEARLLQRDAGSWLTAYQARLSQEHDLPGIKVGFNKIFGYYIELPAAQSRRAPASLSRKQTLKNAERYTTPELQDFETRVLSAESRAIERERELFERLADRCRGVLRAIQDYADVCGELDALLTFARRAAHAGWVRPTMTDEPELMIREGRHPVLERTLGRDFVPNSVALGLTGDDAARLALITGPNMAGKSTFIRQTALLVLLAHAGSFVPAEEARIGLCDRIFTRIGADDALHAGQSTFMVEMIETANILHHAGERSLVILDEIGRGTSTLDGLSLAWAIAEHLAHRGTGSARGPRTLFATHYHELTRLDELYPGNVRNLQVLVREWPPGDPAAQLVFLHRIEPGRADRSYGIHVARLAGLPAPVVARAGEVLATLAVEHRGPTAGSSATPEEPSGASRARERKAPREPEPQMSLFTEYLRHPALDALAEVKLETLTPMQAFDTLRQLKDLLDDPRD